VIHDEADQKETEENCRPLLASNSSIGSGSGGNPEPATLVHEGSIQVEISPGRTCMVWVGRDCDEWIEASRQGRAWIGPIDIFTPLGKVFKMSIFMRAQSLTNAAKRGETGAAQLTPAFGHSPEVPPSGDLQGIVSLLRKWLKECDSTHSQCGEEPVVVLPKRLIDISGHPKLVEGCKLLQSDTSSVSYATLSHCWGKDSDGPSGMMARTLSSNYEQRKVAIE